MSKEAFISAEEIQKHRKKNDLWLAIHGKVYNVSDFMEDHPGGADALLDQAGVDATSAFEDVGHSSDARALMVDLIIGRADKMAPDTRTASADFMKLKQSESIYLTKIVFLVLLLVGIWLLVRAT